MRGVIKAFRVLGAIVAGVVALGAGQALAAGLTASGPDLGSGQQVISACTPDTLLVGYTTAYSPSVGGGGGYAVTDVTVSDTAPTPDLTACAGQPYRVTLLGVGGTPLGEVTGTVPSQSTSFSPATGFASPPAASAVTGVSLVLGG
ncbi:MAG: hypothetical protein ABR950_04785 [Candidatus Dormibacteria bacterium]|jgi:hypothetical protein